MSESIIAIGLWVGVSIIVFLLARELLLWYWKVNTIVKNQELQIELLKEQNEYLARLSGSDKARFVNTSGDSKEEIERKAKLFDEGSREKK